MKKFGLKLEKLMVENNFFYEKNYPKTKVDTDDDSPLDKTLTFPALTIIVN